jgi:hypothetical protein
MTNRLLSQLSKRTIAYVAIIASLALFAALGGTAHAAVTLPQGSYTTHTHHAARTAKASGTCVKACPATTVMWGYFGLNFQKSAWIPLQTAVGGWGTTLEHVGLGQWNVRFDGQNDLTNCARFANLTQIRGSATVLGYSSLNPDPRVIPVLTTDAFGNPVDTGFDVVVFCGGGQGNITSTAPIPAATGP